MTDQKVAKRVHFSECENAPVVGRVIDLLPDDPHEAVAMAAYIAATVIASTGATRETAFNAINMFLDDLEPAYQKIRDAEAEQEQRQ